MKKFAKILIVFLLAFVTALLPIAEFNAVRAADTVTSSAQSPVLPVSYYNTSSSGMTLQIVKGPDGNVWFTQDTTGERGIDNTSNPPGKILAPVKGSIGRITSDGIVTEFPLPDVVYKYIDDDVDSFSFALTSGSDGNLWFTEAEANKVGKITPQGNITTYSLPDTGMYPRSITSGSDGNIWFMIAGSQGREMISMNTAGIIVKTLPVPGSGYGHYEHTLTFGPDGNLWFRGTDYFHNDGKEFVASIGRLTTSGAYSSFTIAGAPVSIVSGNNNDLWVGLNGGVLTRITTDGVTTSYQNTPGELSWILTKGSDNTVWIKDSSANDISTIGSDGTSTFYSLSGTEPTTFANDMVFGSDGNIWFTGYGQVGKISLAILTQTPTPTPTDTPSPTETPIPTPTDVSTVTPTPTIETSTPTPTDVPSITPTPTVTPDPIATPTPTETTTPNPTPTPTDTPSDNPMPTDTPVPSPTCTPTPTPAAVENADENNSQTQTVVAAVNEQFINSSNTPPPTSDGLGNMQIFTSEKGHTSDANLLIEPHQGSMELDVNIGLVDPFTMSDSSATLIPVPWSQGYNTAGDIFKFSATSVFNGYPVTTLDRPAIIMMHYDPSRLFGHAPTELKIGWFNEQTKKWEVLKNNTVIDPKQHLIANTSMHMGYYVVLYSK